MDIGSSSNRAREAKDRYILFPASFRLVFDEAAFEWAYYVRMSHAFKVNLRHLFSELDFASRVEDAPLLKAVHFLQSALRQGKTPRQINASGFPLALIPK